METLFKTPNANDGGDNENDDGDNNDEYNVGGVDESNVESWDQDGCN